MGKKIISSEEFIDRFVERLKERKPFKLTDCIVEGDVDIKDIMRRLKIMKS